MRPHIHIAALAVTAGLAASALVASPASATAQTCKADVVSVYAGNVSEADGQDELRIMVDGNLFPRRNKKHVPLVSGDTAGGAEFENPTSILTSSSDSAAFSLREVDLPFPGQGVELGKAYAYGSGCVGLAVGDTTILPAQTLSGTQPTAYQYQIKLRLTGLS